MTDYRRVIVFRRQINRRQCFGKRADLIHLDQNRIGHVFGNSSAEKIDVRDKDIVAYQLNPFAEFCSEFFPAGPIIWAQPSSIEMIGNRAQRLA